MLNSQVILVLILIEKIVFIDEFEVPYVLRSALKIVRRLLRICVYFQKATVDTFYAVQHF